MRCCSGLHDWNDPVSAKRCCSKYWFRTTRWPGEEGDLDLEGRIYDPNGFIHGWIKLCDEIVEENNTEKNK
jgi:hypothetical protein